MPRELDRIRARLKSGREGVYGTQIDERVSDADTEVVRCRRLRNRVTVQHNSFRSDTNSAGNINSITPKKPATSSG